MKRFVKEFATWKKKRGICRLENEEFSDYVHRTIDYIDRIDYLVLKCDRGLISINECMKELAGM